MAIRLVLKILEALATRPSVGVTELSKELDTTKARVFRHLRTLVDQRYAVQDEGSERYAAGARLIALSRVAALTPYEGLVRLARPTMNRLRDEFGHTVNLSLVYGDSVSIVETLEGNAVIGVVIRTHAGMPLHSTAAGKLLLADRLAREGKIADEPLEKLTENTIVDPESLRMELLRVQEQGWAAAPEETVLGINALSAPIRDHRNELVAMISMLSAIQFISRQPSRELINATKAAAEEISSALKL
ncbi:MAG TPA: IclR family transcriptional regulator [Sphingomonadaceae bacterium]|nr:IclR family transcriptional regulator [Sphingomonadaceae bacterium]